MRFGIVFVAACFGLAGVTLGDDSHAAIRKATNIPAQALGAALQTLAKERKFQIVYVWDELQSLKTQGAVGEFSSQEALTELLRGTGYTYKYLDAETVTIVPAKRDAARALPDTSPTAQGSGAMHILPRLPQNSPSLAGTLRGDEADLGGAPAKRSFWSRFRRAQAGEGGPVEADGGGRSGSEVTLEEVIVTAQKRAERLIDVPISMVALTATELESRRVGSLEDLAMAVPGLSIHSNGDTRRIVLRGISNLSGNSSLVGLYLNEASVTSDATSQLDLRTYDLERVEVLRGPQGTLYGEGSVGGTVRFITRDPNLEQPEFNADIAASFTQDGEPGQQLEGVINVPLINDQLGLRIAGTFDHQGGWMDQPGANRDDMNDQNLVDIRAKLLWEPTALLAVNLMTVIHRNNAPTNTGEDEDGNYTQVFNLTSAPGLEDDYDLFNVTLSYDFAMARLLSTSTYVEQRKETTNFGFRFLGSEIYEPSLRRDGIILTEELRLTSLGSGPLNWTLGGFFRDSEFKTDTAFFFGPPLAPGAAIPAAYGPFQTGAENHSESWAAFGDISYALTERLTLGAGMRYFADDQRDEVLNQAATFSTSNPRFYIQYKLSDGLNTYASAAKGFRSGGFNLLNQPTFDPESVWTYEVGTKASLLEDRFAAELAVFYSDYTDYQITGTLLPPSPPLSVTSNGGSARIRGLEWALGWREGPWSLSVNGNYGESEFYEIKVGASAHAVGDELDLFPRYSYTVAAQRDFAWGSRQGFARIDYSEHGRSTLRNRAFGPDFYSESDLINMLNLNVSVQWNESVSFGLFGRNLLDDRGYTDPYAIQEYAARSRPRTFGIHFNARFN